MASISGPHPISRQLQIKIPVKLADRLRLAPGDELFWRLSDDLPGCLVLIPAEVVERRYGAGEQLELAAAEHGTELNTEALTTKPSAANPSQAHDEPDGTPSNSPDDG